MGGNGDQNLFDLSENAINQLKKPEWVKSITIKGQSYCWCRYSWFMRLNQKFNWNVSRLLDKHERLNSDLLVSKNVNKHLEEKVAKPEMAQAMSE